MIMPDKLVFGGYIGTGVVRLETKLIYPQNTGFAGHYHFYTTGYQHIQIMIDIFSLDTTQSFSLCSVSMDATQSFVLNVPLPYWLATFLSLAC
jgi:hypothetical protein